MLSPRAACTCAVVCQPVRGAASPLINIGSRCCPLQAAARCRLGGRPPPACALYLPQISLTPTYRDRVVCVKSIAMMQCMPHSWLFYVLTTSKVITGRAPTCDSVHGDFIVLPHLETRPPAPTPDPALSHIILTLNQPVLSLS